MSSNHPRADEYSEDYPGDEPTGNVNSKAREEIADLLKELKQDRGVTVVLVTLYETLAQGAERVLQFRDGKIF